MSYYVQVLKNNRSIGRLRHGRADCYGSSYASPAHAKIAARRFLTKFPLPIFECQVRAHKDNKLVASIRATIELEGLKFGEFYVHLTGAGKLYIRHSSGEGGEFNKARFAKAIEKFYKEEF